jgi:putative nucleotidyltransferase with HDIG domain
MITMQRIMEKIGELSPLPPTAPKLAAVVADETSTVKDIADLLQYDQALTLEVLKYANSAMSASARTIATVKDAVVRLGGARILERVVARHVKGVMQAPLTSYGYSEKDLWRHSVASALAAEQLGGITKSSTAGLSFTAALLHDIGKLILGRTAPATDMEHIFLLVVDGRQTITCEQAEQKVLGFSHADVGAEIASTWRLPQPIVDGIRHHHSLDHTAEPVTDAVKVANIVARTIGEGIGNEGMSLAVDNGVSRRLGLSHEQFETICLESARHLAEVLSMFDM